MNLLASYNWIRDYVDVKENAEGFARKVSLCGPSVERQYPQAPLFENMVIGKVLAVNPHPNADKLRLVRTDIGKQELDIVCGGSNLSVGMKVVVALVGAKVRWHGQGDPVELQPAEIRGVKSEGMICGANEIGLADAFPHADKEIMDVSWCKSKPGTSLAKAFGLDDTVFDIEVTTNRPDAFSIVGLAREAAAILGGKFTWKEPVMPSLPKSAKIQEIAVRNQSPRLCARYQAVVMDNITVGPSPWWLKNRLRLAGIRPINNVVDVTNYVMLEYGQPMHAFDYDKIAGKTIVVRTAKAGEKLFMLDGRTMELGADQLVIADAEKPMAVAGVMGGEDSAVHADTKTIVFESATFDPVSVRRTARALNLMSDASLRFEKGLPEELTTAALARAVELCQEAACGRLASHAVDTGFEPHKKAKFVFRPQKAEEIIGVKIPKAKMLSILRALGFAIAGRTGTAKNSKYEIAVPYWRERDIEGERDFAEEIARVYGYHNLPSVIPAGEIPVVPPSPMLRLEEASRDLLKGAGHTELISYSLVSRELLERCGFDPAACLRLANPLSSDFEFMRPSLVPGALLTIKENQGLFPEGRVFEASLVYEPRTGDLPEERSHLLIGIYSTDKDPETRFRAAKGVFETYCRGVGLETAELQPMNRDSKLWHPGRSARITLAGRSVGALGEVHPAVLGRFGVDVGVSLLELDLTAVIGDLRPTLKYVPVSLFPPVLRDLAFVVGERAEYGEIEKAARAAAPLLKEVELFDIYRGANIGEARKSLALHLTFAAPDRTLTAEEADKGVAEIMKVLGEKFGASQRA